MEKQWGALTQYIRYQDDAKIPFKLYDQNGNFYTPASLPNFVIVFYIEYHETIEYTISKTGSTLVHCEIQADDQDGSAIIFANVPGDTFTGNAHGSRLMYKLSPAFSDSNFPDGVYEPGVGGSTGFIYIK